MISLAIKFNGIKSWWHNNQLHRTNGPAIAWISGYKAWFINDERHRTSGPAVIYSDGEIEYWVNGQELSEYVYMFACDVDEKI